MPKGSIGQFEWQSLFDFILVLYGSNKLPLVSPFTEQFQFV